jgi:hypothetical protein
LHRLRLDIIREGADEGSSSGQRELCVAFSQCEFCSLAVGYVSHNNGVETLTADIKLGYRCLGWKLFTVLAQPRHLLAFADTASNIRS